MAGFIGATKKSATPEYSSEELLAMKGILAKAGELKLKHAITRGNSRGTTMMFTKLGKQLVKADLSALRNSLQIPFREKLVRVVVNPSTPVVVNGANKKLYEVELSFPRIAKGAPASLVRLRK